MIILKEYLVYTFIRIFKKVGLVKYLSHYLSHRNQKHNPMLLLRIILFIFINNEPSLRYSWLSETKYNLFYNITVFQKERTER